MRKNGFTYGLLVAFFMLSWTISQSQILSPDLHCVKNDTLFWSTTPNSCGPFLSYDIYYSSLPDGPFALLSSVLLENEVFFHHPNPGNDPYYYFILGNYDCPGFSIIPSDTISNQPLAPIKIQQVSINNGAVEISWNPSQNAEISAFIIYKSTSLGTVPIDTVYNTLTYTDLFSDASFKSESYFVIGLNECGTTTPFDLPHSTVFMESSVEPCKRSIEVFWSPYSSWENKVREQSIWVKINNGPELQYQVLDSNSNYIAIENINDGLTYCFRILANEDNSSAFSYSNQICVTPDIIQPMKNINITNLTVNSNGQLDLFWQWNDNAELSEAGLYEGINTPPLNLYQSLDHVNLTEDNSIEIAADPGSASYSFEIISKDQCDSIKSSKIAKALRLFASQQSDESIFLTWSEFNIPGMNVLAHDIYRDAGLGFQHLGTLFPEDSVFIDPALDISSNISEYCYRVLTSFELTLPNGSIVQNQALSNTECIYEDIAIWFPNAFAPAGQNRVFKPVVKHPTSIVSYNLKIYNRWGSILFESIDPEIGWSGYRDGRIMSPGIYTFQAIVRQEGGREITEMGQVLLLR